LGLGVDIMCYDENWKQGTCACGRPPPKKHFSGGGIVRYEYPVSICTHRLGTFPVYRWVYLSENESEVIKVGEI
jgi:hypothetical protein